MSETLAVDAACEIGPKTAELEPQMGEQITAEDGGGVGSIRFGKRRKTRRGKPKRRKLKPYSRLWLDDKHKAAKYAQPEAPYNTTQFLIADHNDLQGLDDQLRAVDPPPRPPRARDSSFSVDSDEDYFYSSPEDEGDFLSKEFSNTYEDLHAERIGAMSKTQLIQEYLMLEEKVGLLEARLKTAETKLVSAEEDNEDAALELYKREVEKLHLENQQLRRENDRLRKKKSPSVSSVDSESDSSSSSSCSGSEESCCSDTEEKSDLK